MNSPSGDHSGHVLSFSPDDVNWTGLDPSALATQTSWVPDLPETKAMRLPSGE
jgi:hypothetical protein